MWFKNLAVYRLQETVFIRSVLNEALLQRPFTPCQAQDEFSFGFVPPVNESSDVLVREVALHLMVCGKKEERILPSAAINEELAKRLKEIEEREARKLPAKERLRMKDELIFELLPRALTKSAKTFAYIDLANGYLIVDSASSKKAEDLLRQLRKCLGSLPVVPLQAIVKPAGVMTQWVTDPENCLPAGFALDDECELRSPDKTGGVIRGKHCEGDAGEWARSHIEAGMVVHKLALTWRDRISFTLDANLAIKRLKFLDLVQEQAADTEAFDEAEQFDGDFTIMAGEIANLLADLVEAFGGRPEQAATS
ncbi:recombination-associated protein RdgC [Methylomonas montana]|uniref:recombination-associated protein RdgC n=1 Tax=Methylomonas montana TaxID=3058963 RepID=UPI0026585657|nr:recombination-associated protein RdgC [Methylomonas montana]WKJ88789.1 recombination-associated protein RdgC [Methylomonas montana]